VVALDGGAGRGGLGRYGRARLEAGDSSQGSTQATVKKPKKKAPGLEKLAAKFQAKLNAAKEAGAEAATVKSSGAAPEIPSAPWGSAGSTPAGAPLPPGSGSLGKPKVPAPDDPALAGGLTSYPNSPDMGKFFDNLLGAGVPAATGALGDIAGGANVWDSLGSAGGKFLSGLLPGESGGYPTASPAPASSSEGVPTWVWIAGGLVAVVILWKVLK
jgi:hypothetical protein